MTPAALRWTESAESLRWSAATRGAQSIPTADPPGSISRRAAICYPRPMVPADPAPRILVADDQPDVLQAIKLLLRGEPYAIDTATFRNP